MSSNSNNQKTSISITMDLEKLQQKYSNLLTKYKAAVSEYVLFLNQQSKQPCGTYKSTSNGISQKCYDYIWSRSGCVTSAPNANNEWSKNQTLNGLINDSFLWATMTDYSHRMGCYNKPGNPYIILGVGTDGNLWSRQGLDAPWEKVNDNSNGNLIGIFTHPNGQTIYGVNKQNLIISKNSYNDTKWNGGDSCCVMSAAMGKDGTIVGVGMNNKLWSIKWNVTGWQQTESPGEWITSVTIAPDDSIFVIGGGNQIWKKKSYLNLQSQSWESQGSCCVKAITIAPDGTFIGVGTDNKLYTKTSYKDLSTPWKGPYDSFFGSCCVTSITTVINTNYDSSKFSSATAPNYNINQTPFVSIKGQAFIGTGSAGQSTATTLQDCEASCAKLSNCSGATFISGKCDIRVGDSPIITSSENSYAIVPKSKQLLYNMENINQQLLAINKEINNKIQTNQPIFYKNDTEVKQKTKELLSNYENLTKERETILELLNQYETLDRTDEQNLIKINQNYYSYILLTVLAFAVFYILYRISITSETPTIQYGGDLGMNAYYILFFIILITIMIPLKNLLY